ncbi:MAG: SGNH/GDSL hydrolase family protein, partial [bacterium]|nr:SGNH/GDSL hydrolase family protein [bacterium]
RTAGLILLITLALCVAVLEVLGQTRLGDIQPLIYFRALTHIVKVDVDHRNTPGLNPGINSDGIRSLREAPGVKRSDFNIVFLGDSFVYGKGLNYYKTVPYQLEELLRAESGPAISVFNFGWISSSPVLSRRLLEDVGHKYQPDLVLLGLDMTDFRDDLLYSNILNGKKMFRLKKFFPASLVALDLFLEKSRVLSPVRKALFGVPAERFFPTNQPLAESRPYLETTLEALEGIRDYSVDELDADFALVLFPRNYQYSEVESPNSWERELYEPLGPYVLEPFRLFSESADELPYPVLSLLEAFRATEVHPHCFHDDPHWNVAGAALAARAIGEQIRQAGLLSPGDGSL